MYFRMGCNAEIARLYNPINVLCSQCNTANMILYLPAEGQDLLTRSMFYINLIALSWELS